MLTALGVVEYSLGPMIIREMAILSALGTGSSQEQRDLLRTTEVLYLVLLTAIAAVVYLAAPEIASTWLSKSAIPIPTLIAAVRLMGCTVAMQLFCSLYWNVLNGIERQLTSNLLTTALVAIRGGAALSVLLALSATVEAYFISQLAVTALLLVASGLTAWCYLPRTSSFARLQPKLLAKTWRQTGPLTGAAVLFVLLSQADKFIASSLSSLRDFGYYVIASIVVSLMFSVYGAVGTALVPRFARAITDGSDTEIARLLHLATQFMGLVLLPLAGVIIFCGQEFFLLWTGSHSIAANVAPIAALLSLGTLFACLACATNSLQLAAGYFNLNLVNNLVWALAVPPATLLTMYYGPIGATTMWLVSGMVSVAVAPTLLHRRMLKGEQISWMIKDIAIPTLVAGMSAGGISIFVRPLSKPGIALELLGFWILTSLVSLMAMPQLRGLIFNEARKTVAVIFGALRKSK
jgi:O-antigen/teichoic acid export membrane protein